jgi:ribonuclease E
VREHEDSEDKGLDEVAHAFPQNVSEGDPAEGPLGLSAEEVFEDSSIQPPEQFEDRPTTQDDDFEEQRPSRRLQKDGRRDGRRGRPFPARFGMSRPKPLIQDIFRRGQEVLVQVIKEGIGTKGPTLSTYISIAGRYLVLMPGLNRIGVSRKIADEEQRRRLREVLHELQPPKGLGFIIRTAGLDKNKKELQRDLAYLSRLWQVVVRRIRKLKGPAEIYQESDMITRTIRDTFTSEIDSIWVDEPAAFEHAQEFLQIVMPRYASRIKLFSDSEPLFHKYGIEDEIARIQLRHVPLPNGGSIVIDQTEALVAIDVNSGNFRADNNAEETAYQMNLLAAREIARQLRLRDLGGVIVNDFIDMRDEKHRRGVERALREAIKRDRARTKILKISAFGIIEMTRQRIRPSLKRSVYQDCPHCMGTGQVKTCESMSIDVMRMLQLAAHRDNIHRIQVSVADDVAHYLVNKKRKEITSLEEAGEIQVTITGMPGAAPEKLDFVCYDNNNNEIKFFPYEENGIKRK